ncbi:MAG: polysaccharide biosynthesis tyrosine autokinase [Oscillospiraceae bacterium]|nr:polysaccharide biosynthesis tyrosine autokinase [Oscillospiraceae bacterium]
MQEDSYTAVRGSSVPLPFQLDYGRLLRTILRRFWLIALVALVAGSGLYFNSKQKARTVYRAVTTLAFTVVTYQEEVRNPGTGQEVKISVPVRGYYSSANPNRFSILLRSDTVVEKLSAALDGKYDMEAIRESVDIEAMEEPGFFTLGVTNENPTLCNEVLNALISMYPEYLKRFESTLGIEIVRRPKPAAVVDNSDESKTMAIYGILGGGGLTAALFVMLELSRNTIRSAQDIRSKTSERMIGMLPFQASSRRFQRKKSDRVMHIMDKRSVSFDFIENVKAIRTKLENAAAEMGAKVIAVTSTFEGEGKTTLTINLACALAQKGKSVLIIDCDLRKPAALKSVGAKDSDASGILPILAGKSRYEDSVKYLKPLRFFVLSTGGTTANPTEKLAVPAMKEIVDKARQEFDYVLLDTPPARVVADCITLAPLMDGLLFAVRYDFARVQQINETMEEISNAGVRIIGTVLTMAASDNLVRRNGYSSAYRRPGKYYGGYGYGYGYGAESRYGYGYGQDGANNRRLAMRGEAPEGEQTEAEL